MVTTEYKIAYSEVLEILKHVSKDDFNRIPQNMIEMFKLNANNDNNFKYNLNKTLQEQNVSEIARTIIAILFRDYWATVEQKEKILFIQNSEREKYKQEKYNADNLFKKSKQYKKVEENIRTENVAIIECKETLFEKIITKIKKLFHIK